MAPSFELISRRALIKMPVKMIVQLQEHKHRQFSLSNGDLQLKIMITFLQKIFFILNYCHPAKHLECVN